MATLTVQSIVRSGNVPTYAAAAGGGDQFERRSGGAFAHIKNGSGGAITVTIQSQAAPGVGETQADETVSVGAASEKMIGPFPKEFENVNGRVELTYSGVTSLTIGVFDLQ